MREVATQLDRLIGRARGRNRRPALSCCRQRAVGHVPPASSMRQRSVKAVKIHKRDYAQAHVVLPASIAPTSPVGDLLVELTECRTVHIVGVTFAGRAPASAGPYYTYPQSYDLHVYSSFVIKEK
ncbi:hypothetical protein EVAR_34049_1 [Eumeta japonica]|uniref:Uncharacterized protein n=1 Tax=Eumeta variegata TaxID=151549 RepID=A0A4C1VR61_EUMVA|nr:hypothetical protein EVAR_34049_1 [Eumeta japonica]